MDLFIQYVDDVALTLVSLRASDQLSLTCDR
jgi:hypothetical protein